MKKLFLFILVLLPFTLKHIEANNLRFINEVNEVSLSSNKKSLIIKGWGFIQDAQNYYNNNTHDYTLILEAKDHQIEVKGSQQSISHTDTMYFVGSRYCSDSEFRKDSLICNNYYENIGFNFEIPLTQLKMEKDYKVFLKINAKQAKLEKITEVYFPNKEVITIKDKHDHYIIDSKLHNVGVKVLNSHILVRDKPHKQGKILQASTECSQDKSLYYKKGSTFKSIYDKTLHNNTTYYRLKGKYSACYSQMNVIEEGNDYDPIWIASTFIEHVGEALTIKTKQLNNAPVLNVGDDIRVYVNDKVDIWKDVSAYDEEDGDLSDSIKIKSNNYKNEIGNYQVTFSVTDSFNTTSTATRNIIVMKKNYPPQIIANDITIFQYSSYNPYDYAKAYDQNNNDITRFIQSTSYINTHQLGKQRQCYMVEDRFRLKAHRCIWVSVIEQKSSFRFLQHKNLFYKENVPSAWKNKLKQLQEELDNDIIYDHISINN